MIDYTTTNSGAKFYKADLHIHSYGEDGSFDVTDTTMTPENIVDISIEKGLSIIAITDHNEVQNSKKAIKHAEGKEILVIPGIEISTLQGHLLVYFEKHEDLKNFRGKLTISDDRETCTQGIVECLNFAKQYNGLGILAHISSNAGFEKTIGRFDPKMSKILEHECLYGLEISDKSEIDLYTERDKSEDGQKRMHFVNQRIDFLDSEKDFEFPKLMSSDAHTTDRLGTNADGEKKLTRIKLDIISFHAFRIALISSNSRVRIENLIPEKLPRFVGVSLNGGLLANQIIHFSSNLTCIIGGRGAGKSTLLEALRVGSGNNSEMSVVDSEVWPDEINLTYEDETGQLISFVREKNSYPLNSSTEEGLSKIPIESYGQGETAKTIQFSEQNPQYLIDFLNSFLDLDELNSDDRTLRDKLHENQSNLRGLRLAVTQIPEVTKMKVNLEGKLKQLQQDKASELVNFHLALVREKEIRTDIKEDLNELFTKYRDILSDKTIFDSFEEIDGNEIKVGKDNFIKVKEIVKMFGDIVSVKQIELSTELKQKIEELKVQLQDWASKETEIQAKINAKKKELEEKGIPFDIGKINQITKDVVTYQNKLKLLKQKEVELKDLLKSRDVLIRQRLDVKSKIYYQHYEFGKTINDNLKNSVDDFFVSVKYKEGKYSPSFEQAIKNLAQWRLNKKSEAFANSITPLEFVMAIRKKNLDFMKDIEDQNGRMFNDEEINSLLSKAQENYNYEDFDTLDYDDRPSIIVTKTVSDENGTMQTVRRSLNQLSLGQQQSILLAILLQSKSKVPLLIDQPEDNLDSEFIYKSIVKNLRRIKEFRQVIIVTHNPNIAVLGDAELIIPLKSTSIKSVIMERGSIDTEQTRKSCCEILEGGKQAFKRRQEIYKI
ncbi:TrlF family AAA-like ATPase [Labilibaculum antarcticum]|uniref:Histidinol-phosphatase n=1 Tax=Labilibaculum antarcticum TaxID=1717717 RepID=A0A1Y1CMT5_9BACT|nr:AAA family ATPase [Labilibaculum antarcticum]BAX81749.1 histidinol-phosphatase [Labilibaculum antarcticum]